MSLDLDTLVSVLDDADDISQVGIRKSQAKLRGMPDRSSLRSLAATYLEEQHRWWPNLVGKAFPDAAIKPSIDEMVAIFEQAYLSGEPAVFHDTGLLQPDVAVGAAYSRYSAANSNPRSLNQQLINELAAAAKERVFIPWQYVLADAAITGTTDRRRAYQLMKSLIVRQGNPVTCFYIDELGRASRDHIESLNLGRLVEQSGKRLVGATDGFDSSNPMSKIMLSVFSMIHELFVDQLREKVDRGMKDAFRQGKHLYKPAFGYALEPIYDEHGNVLVDSDGKVINQVVVAPDDAEQIRRAFRLFADEGWSPQRIARLFNKEKVDDREKWSNSLVRNMLKREMYQGKEAWGRTTKKIDPKTGVQKTVAVPQDQWHWRDVPHLRIVDAELWNRTQDRFIELSKAYDPNDDSISRSEGHSKRLFNFFCHECGGPMWSDRGGTRQVVCCPRGRDGIDGCKANRSKTVKHIEDSILNYVLGQFVDEKFMMDLVDQANKYLKELSALPKPDTTHNESELKRLISTRDKIVNAMEELPDSANLKSVLMKVAEMEKEISDLKDQLAEAKLSAVTPEPIRYDQAFELLKPLRDLLYENTEASTKLLASIVGRVKLEQGEVISERRCHWFAHFTMNAVPVLLEIARHHDCPRTDTWEYLSIRSWTMKTAARVELHQITNAERLAKTVAEMIEAGTSRNMVAVALASDSDTIDEAMKHWESGVRCYLPPKDFSFRRQQPTSKAEKNSKRGGTPF